MSNELIITTWITGLNAVDCRSQYMSNREALKTMTPPLFHGRRTLSIRGVYFQLIPDKLAR